MLYRRQTLGTKMGRFEEEQPTHLLIALKADLNIAANDPLQQLLLTPNLILAKIYR